MGGGWPCTTFKVEVALAGEASLLGLGILLGLDHLQEAEVIEHQEFRMLLDFLLIRCHRHTNGLRGVQGNLDLYAASTCDRRGGIGVLCSDTVVLPWCKGLLRRVSPFGTS